MARRWLGALVALLVSSFAAVAQDSPLSGLPAVPNVLGTDLFYDVQTPGIGGGKATAGQIATYLFGQVKGACSASSGGSLNCGITRAQIPTTHIGANQTIMTMGYRNLGDRGFGAWYTSVMATSTGLEAIQDADGNWFNLTININGFTDNSMDRGVVNVGWFGAYGDNGSETITSGDISANPAWRGTYTAGQMWDYVASQEAVYAAFAVNSTPGSIVWNANTNDFNSVLYVPPGWYTINHTITSVMEGFKIDFGGRAPFGARYIWSATTYGTAFLFNSASYGLFENFSVDCSSPGNATFSPSTNNPCVKLDHNGASPGGLKTQQITFLNSWINVGLNGQGISINPDSQSSGQGDHILFLNPYFAGDFQSSIYGLETNGDNTLQVVIQDGDIQGFPVMGVHNNGGQVFMYGTSFENEIFNGNSKTPILNQFTTGGADVRNDGSVSSVNATRLDSVRSEAEIISQACCGGLTDIFSSITTGSDVASWTASNPYMAGQVIHGGTQNRAFMVVDNGGVCSQFCAMTPGVGTNTFTDSGASYTTNQWVGFTAWLRNPTNANTFPCPITANTATTVTYGGGCGVLAAGQTQYQIGGSSGSSAPSWDSATRGYSFLNSFSTTSGSSCVGIDSGAFSTVSNNDWVVIPLGDQLTQSAITGALTFQMPLYAKLTSKTSSACAGSSLADKATANKNAGVTFNPGGQNVAYGSPGVTDNNITWIQLAFDSARGFNNIAGLFSSFGYVGAPYGVGTNITSNQSDRTFDPTGTPPQSGGNSAHNILNATDERWFCAFAGSGTVDLTSCLKGASILRTQPTGAITLNAPKTDQFMQLMTLMFQGTGGSPATITFNTNFGATSSLIVGTDSTKYWIITFIANANSPLGSSSWYEVSRSVNGNLNKAGTNSTVSAPAGPNSTSSFTMQGLAGTITPAVSGNISLQICGTVIETGITAAGSGIKYQLSYGTGTAPTSNAALAGTQAGTVQEYMLANTVTAADVFVPFCQTTVITGLTVGTAYWLDLAAEAVANTGFSLSNVNIAANEF